MSYTVRSFDYFIATVCISVNIEYSLSDLSSHFQRETLYESIKKKMSVAAHAEPIYLWKL